MIMNSSDIKMPKGTPDKPFVNCIMSEHAKGDTGRIGYAFDCSSSGLRAAAALIRKFEKAGLKTEPLEDRGKVFGTEIIGKEAIERYKTLGGKILRPNSCKDIQDADLAFRTGAEGTILEAKISSPKEGDKIARLLEAMGVPYQLNEKSIRIDDPVGIHVIAYSGGMFNGSEKFKDLFGRLHREFWVQGGNDLLEEEGVHVYSAISLPDDDTPSNHHRRRIANEPPPSWERK